MRIWFGYEQARESAFKSVVKTLKSKGVEHSFLSERWLPDKIMTDMMNYLLRIRNWRRFKNEEVI